MRREIALLIALTAPFALSACSDSDDPKMNANTTTEPTNEATDPESTKTEPTDSDETEPETTSPEKTDSVNTEDAESRMTKLKAYADLERAAFDNADPAMLALYSDVTIEPEATTTISRIVATYTFADSRDPETVRPEFELQIDTLTEALENPIFPTMEKLNISQTRQFTYTYNNPDGELLWSQTFMDAGDGTVCNFTTEPIEDSPDTCDDVE